MVILIVDAGKRGWYSVTCVRNKMKLGLTRRKFFNKTGTPKSHAVSNLVRMVLFFCPEARKRDFPVRQAILRYKRF